MDIIYTVEDESLLELLGVGVPVVDILKCQKTL